MRRRDADAPSARTHDPATTSLLATSELRAFSRLRPWRSLRQILTEWASLATAVAVAQIVGHPAVTALAVIWIGARQHALLILMHEGAHRRLSSRPWVNDGLAELLCSWPLLVSMRGYRRNHNAHHRWTNTSADPDWIRKRGWPWRFPKSRVGLVALGLLNQFGLGAASLVQGLVVLSRPDLQARGRAAGEVVYQVLRAAFLVAVGLATAKLGLGRELLVFWIVPMFTWLVLTLHLRSIAEHFGIDYDHRWRNTRTTLATRGERWLLAPNAIHFHLEHHLFPSVPFYNLESLHRRLMQNEAYRTQAHVTEGYLGVLADCLVTRTARPEGRPAPHDAVAIG